MSTLGETPGFAETLSNISRSNLGRELRFPAYVGPRSFYIAGKFTSKDRLALEAAKLVAAGFADNSYWLNETETDYTASDDYKKTCASRDIADVLRSGFLVLDTLDESPTGGREVEFGIALSRNIPVYLVGPCRNVFHLLATCVYESWEEFHGRKTYPTG